LFLFNRGCRDSGGPVSRVLQTLLSWPVATGVHLQQCDVKLMMLYVTPIPVADYLTYIHILSVAKLD